MALTSQAQFQKGDWKVTAGATFDFTKQNPDEMPDEKSSTYIYRIAPGVEYFISNRFSVGLSPFWQESNMDYKGGILFSHEDIGTNMAVYADEKVYMKDIGLEASVKYYQPIARNFYVTVKGFFSYAHAKFTDRGTMLGSIDDKNFLVAAELKGKTASYMAGITPGLSYWFSDRWSVQLDFLPVFYQKDKNRKSEDWQLVTVVAHDPLLGWGAPNMSNPIEGSHVSDMVDIERRKNNFDLNWGSFTIGVSYKF